MIRRLRKLARGPAILLGTSVGLLAVAPSSEAAEKFRRLSGDKIRAGFAGMEMSDDVHWRDWFQRDGTLKSQSMGAARTGKWRVVGNELCVDRGKDSGGCYQVWVASTKVEFRREGLDDPVLAGTLQKPKSPR